jgi:uncharacterized protein YkwD
MGGHSSESREITMTTMLRFSKVSGVALALALLFALVSSMHTATVAHAAAYQPVTTEAACLNTQEAEFLRLINSYRASKGLPALKASKALNVASFHHSKDMAVRKYFSHTTKSPLLSGQSGSSPWARMADAGYGYSTYKGENIAAGQTTAQAVFNAWKNSSGHNANMLNPNFKVIGIGMAVVSGSPYGTYWTTDFGGVVDVAGC